MICTSYYLLHVQQFQQQTTIYSMAISTSYYLQYSNFKNKLLFTVQLFQQQATIYTTAISTGYYLRSSNFNKLLFTMQLFQQQATVYSAAVSISYCLQSSYFNKLLFTMQQFQQHSGIMSTCFNQHSGQYYVCTPLLPVWKYCNWRHCSFQTDKYTQLYFVIYICYA